MKSPITGKEMSLQKEKRTLSFRKEEFEVLYHYFLCDDSKEQFTSTEIDEVNMNQVYNQYREKYHLPFPDDIIALREKYSLPAIKMAEILGFGANVYRNYESGEIPSQSNARLIQLAQDTVEFKKLVNLSGVYKGEELDKILNRIDKIIESEKDIFSIKFEEYLMGDSTADIYSGYRKPNLEKFTEMIVYFTEKLQPYKTKMNKLLFYADFLQFKNTCFSMSGARYRAIDMGPVPNKFNSLFEYVANNDHIDLCQTEFPDGKTGEQFKPNAKRSFNPDVFSKEEMNVLQHVAKTFEKATANEIIEISHKEKAWIVNFHDGKKLIPYNHGFELATI